MHKYILNLVTVAMLFIFAGCTTVPITGRRQLNFVPDSLMQSMSYEAYNEFLQENKVSTNETKQQQVKQVGNQIRQSVEQYAQENNIDLSGYKWEFTLIDSEQKNAWAMPGGKVVVYSGILEVARNDAGLATVMGHEIAHVIAEHGSERMSQQLLRDMGGKALQKALEDEPEKTQTLFNLAYGVGTEVGVILRYSRVHETEADRLGMIFMAMAGYDPAAAISFWQRMMESKEGGAKPPEFLSTHPADQTRINNLYGFLEEAQRYYRK